MKPLHKPIKKWIPDERPREMMLKIGADKMPLAKLLAIVLRTGRAGASAEELARTVINQFGSLRKLDLAQVHDLCRISGIGLAKAVEIKAALEIGKRFSREEAGSERSIVNPSDALRYVRKYYGPYFRDAAKEFFNIVLLNTKHMPISNLELSKGILNASLVDPKEIVREAILRSASSVIVIHNHPSGVTEPSAQDIDVTKRIVETCRLFGIDVLDHIIIGKNARDYFSFAKAELMK